MSSTNCILCGEYIASQNEPVKFWLKDQIKKRMELSRINKGHESAEWYKEDASELQLQLEDFEKNYGDDRTRLAHHFETCGGLKIILKQLNRKETK